MPRPDHVLAEMPAAGKAGAAAANTSSMAETLGGYRAPPTPDKLRPFRMSGKAEVGLQGSHYAKGTAFNVPDRRYGRVNTYEESTASRFAEMREPVFQPKARAYASEIREPLGKSMTYGFRLPNEMDAPEFKFGKPTNTSEPVKTVMYPPEGAGAVPAHKEPMHQTQRNYDWAKVQIDPTDFRFGVASKQEANEVFSPTQLVPLPTLDQRNQNQGDIGVPRVSGFAPKMDPGHTYGRTMPRSGETMQQVLSQQGDTPADLGKSHTRSSTLRKLREQDSMSRSGESDRTFGMPSIRADKAPPKVPKITGNTNFGDEPGAHQLLFPAPDTASGAQRVLRNVDEAEVIANRCKFGLTRAQVERAYGYAARIARPVTAASFKQAVDELDA